MKWLTVVVVHMAVVLLAVVYAAGVVCALLACRESVIDSENSQKTKNKDFK